MAKENGIVYVRMDADLKREAEAILDQLGVSASGAVQMFYKQIIMNKGLPFELKLPKQSIFIEDYTDEELIESLEKTHKDYENGNYYTSEEVKEMLFGKGRKR